MTLLEQLVDARLVRSLPEQGVVLVWKGGHGVHAFDEHGHELHYRSVGDFALNDAAESDILEAFEDIARDGFTPDATCEDYERAAG